MTSTSIPSSSPAQGAFPPDLAADLAGRGEAVLSWFQQGHTLAEAMDFGERELVVLYTAGFDLAGQGRLEDALRVFGTLASLDPFQGRFQHAVATCLQRLGRFRDAAASYATLKLLEPENPEVLYRLAECLLACGEREAAAGMLDSLVEECEPASAATAGGPSAEATAWATRARALCRLLREGTEPAPSSSSPSTPSQNSQGASS